MAVILLWEMWFYPFLLIIIVTVSYPSNLDKEYVWFGQKRLHLNGNLYLFVFIWFTKNIYLYLFDSFSKLFTCICIYLIQIFSFVFEFEWKRRIWTQLWFKMAAKMVEICLKITFFSLQLPIVKVSFWYFCKCYSIDVHQYINDYLAHLHIQNGRHNGRNMFKKHILSLQSTICIVSFRYLLIIFRVA